MNRIFNSTLTGLVVDPLTYSELTDITLGVGSGRAPMPAQTSKPIHTNPRVTEMG